MLIHNASYTIKNSLGHTPFHRIAANGHLALAEKLLKHVKKNGKSVSDVLNVQDKRENTPLHLAAEEERGILFYIKLPVKLPCFFRRFCRTYYKRVY